jgi:amidase
LRNPSAWTGVIGFKPGRWTIPGPAALSGWHGMVVNGPIARRAADLGAFMDAVVGGDSFSAAAAAPRERLRIAMTFKQPPGMGGSLDEHRERAVHEAADLLRQLGHEVVERDPELPKLTALGIDARYFGGIADDVAMMDHPDRLESRTRSVARLGRALAPALRVAGRIERAAAAALDEVHRDCDLLLFPGSVVAPHPIGRFNDRGALYTGWADTAAVAYQPLWNLVGRPATMVPWDFDADGLPTAVQFGAPAGGERLLLALVGELERVRCWPDVKPPLASFAGPSDG